MPKMYLEIKAYCYFYDVMTVKCVVLTQTAVGHYYVGVCLAVAPTSLTPGRDGDRSF